MHTQTHTRSTITKHTHVKPKLQGVGAEIIQSGEEATGREENVPTQVSWPARRHKNTAKDQRGAQRGVKGANIQPPQVLGKLFASGRVLVAREEGVINGLIGSRGALLARGRVIELELMTMGTQAGAAKAKPSAQAGDRAVVRQQVGCQPGKIVTPVRAQGTLLRSPPVAIGKGDSKGLERRGPE